MVKKWNGLDKKKLIHEENEKTIESQETSRNLSIFQKTGKKQVQLFPMKALSIALNHTPTVQDSMAE